MTAPLTIRLSPVLWLQTLALLIGGGTLLVTTDRDTYLLCIGTFTAVGVMGLLRSMFTAAEITIWDVFLTSLCLGYGLGTLNTELTWVNMPKDYLTLTRAAPLYVFRSAAWLMLLGAAISAASSLDHHHIFKGIDIDPALHDLIAWGIFLVTLAAVIQVATGAIGFHQDMNDGGEGRVSALAALTVSLMCPAAALASFVVQRLAGWRKQIVWGSLAVLLLIQAYQGRRVFIYTVILALICSFAAGHGKRVLTRSRVVGLLVAVLMIFAASKAFYALRMASWELQSTKDKVALLSKGYEILSSSSRSGLDDEVQDNQKARTFIIGYLAEIVEALEEREPMYGDVLGFDLAISVPSVIWPGKYKVLAVGAEEGVANNRLGILLEDEANSIETTGASDFGIPGIFLYSFGLVLLYGLCLRWARKLGGVVYLLITAALVNVLLNVEIGTADYIGVLRSIAMLLLAGWVALRLWQSLSSREPVAFMLPWQRRTRRFARWLQPYLAIVSGQARAWRARMPVWRRPWRKAEADPALMGGKEASGL
jgi:hypothetical protein